MYPAGTMEENLAYVSSLSTTFCPQNLLCFSTNRHFKVTLKWFKVQETVAVYRLGEYKNAINCTNGSLFYHHHHHFLFCAVSVDRYLCVWPSFNSFAYKRTSSPSLAVPSSEKRPHYKYLLVYFGRLHVNKL